MAALYCKLSRIKYFKCGYFDLEIKSFYRSILHRPGLLSSNSFDKLNFDKSGSECLNSGIISRLIYFATTSTSVERIAALIMETTKTDEQPQPAQAATNVSQKKRNRNKSNTQVKVDVDPACEEIPVEDAMKGLTLAPHQVQNIFHFAFSLIIFMNV